MKQSNFKLILVCSLIGFSLFMFLFQYMAFHDLRDTFYYMMQDIAFLPLQVLLVTLVLERILGTKEKQERLNKQNMVIGVFFSQIGVGLLRLFSSWDPNLKNNPGNLLIQKSCTDSDFKELHAMFSNYKSGIIPQAIDCDVLKETLVGNKGFLVGLLENQNLLEHEQFTDLLWATFHLLEEMMYRKDFSRIPESDKNHCVIDINRAYSLLICQWIKYMQHLQKNYPYLFSLAMRTNPFDVNARITVE